MFVLQFVCWHDQLNSYGLINLHEVLRKSYRTPRYKKRSFELRE